MPDTNYATSAHNATLVAAGHSLTRDTTLRLGVQGVRFGWVDRQSVRNALAFRFRDKTEPLDDFSTTDTVVLFENFSDYWGRRLAVTVGFHRTAKEFRLRRSRIRDERFARLFVKVIAGIE